MPESISTALQSDLHSSLTISEEGPAWLAPVERGKGLLLLAHKSIPPHLFRPSELPDFLQAALYVVDGVIGPVVHQPRQQALRKTGRGFIRNSQRIGREEMFVLAPLHLCYNVLLCDSVAASGEHARLECDPVVLTWLHQRNKTSNSVRTPWNETQPGNDTQNPDARLLLLWRRNSDCDERENDLPVWHLSPWTLNTFLWDFVSTLLSNNCQHAAWKPESFAPTENN